RGGRALGVGGGGERRGEHRQPARRHGCVGAHQRDDLLWGERRILRELDREQLRQRERLRRVVGAGVGEDVPREQVRAWQVPRGGAIPGRERRLALLRAFGRLGRVALLAEAGERPAERVESHRLREQRPGERLYLLQRERPAATTRTFERSTRESIISSTWSTVARSTSPRTLAWSWPSRATWFHAASAH